MLTLGFSCVLLKGGMGYFILFLRIGVLREMDHGFSGRLVNSSIIETNTITIYMKLWKCKCGMPLVILLNL